MGLPQVPLVVCVTSDVEMRGMLARRLSGFGVVLMVSDMAQLRTVLRTAEGELFNSAPEPDGALGELVIDIGAHWASWRRSPLQLTRMELQLLSNLADPPITVWSHERLYVTVWGSPYLGDASAVHAAMRRLRKKLHAAGDGITIDTVRGVGYRLVIGEDPKLSQVPASG